VGPFITCRGNDVGPVFGVGGGTRTQVLVTPESRILNERTKMHSVRHKVDQRAGLSHVTNSLTKIRQKSNLNIKTDEQEIQ